MSKAERRQKIKIREKNANFIPSLINLQILGCGATGSPASVYLFTDHSRYLFNCGEGTQRLAHEHKTKLTRLEHIFVTQNNWKCTGGLPGLSLTVQDAGVPDITLHGPPKINEVFKAMRNFFVLKQLNVHAPNCDENGFYDDSVLRIDYIPFKKVSPDTHVDTVMGFLCKLKPRPGSLCLQKCLDRGISSGPILGRLKNGETITLPNGDLVKPEEVCEPSDPGSSFLVIDVPVIDYLESLLNNEKLKDCQKMTNNDNHLELILDFSPQSIIERPEYQNFIKSFPDTTKHLRLNESNRFSGYVATHRLQWQLHQLNADIFPILKEPTLEPDHEHSNSKKIKLDDSAVVVNKDRSDEEGNSRLSAMTYYHLRPKRGFDRTFEVAVNPDEYINEIGQIDGFQESLETLKQKMALCNKTGRSDQYPRIVFLGTGSCIPNKNRNVSAMIVHISKDTCILLDVGEGTMGQIYRFYGDETHEILKKLKAVYISHLHADHHIGLFGVIQFRNSVFAGTVPPPLLLLAPQLISNWLDFYNKNIEPIKSGLKLIANESLVENGLSSEYVEKFDLSSLKTCYVHHCPHAFGVAISLKCKANHGKPIKITYSGDTMPCKNLVKLGENSYLLIHEATMEDELFKDASYKFHSTVSQAIEQGHKMNAKYILLTHFSQRYAKLPRIEHHLVQNIGIAFDNMEVVPSDLDNLNILYPTLRKMFAESWDEMKQKSLKRAQRKAIAQIEKLNR